MHERMALVTGSSKGVGRDIALRLADVTGGVLVHYRKNRKAAQEVVEQIKAKGKLSACYSADLTKESQAFDLIKRAEDMQGRLDILVNSVGPLLVKPWEQMTTDEWDYELRSNLYTALFCLKAALSGMRRRKWGRIVNIGFSRVEQLAAYSRIVPYAIAKTGLLILTRSAARSVAPQGITVNMVSPGLLKGGILPKDQSIPVGRLGEFGDVSSAVVFLASDQASYITGANVIVAGGWKI